MGTWRDLTNHESEEITLSLVLFSRPVVNLAFKKERDSKKENEIGCLTHQKRLWIQVAYLRVKIWWPQVGLPGMALHRQTLVITKTQKSHCPATSLELLPKVSLLRSDHLSYLGIWDQKPVCSFSGASSFSRLGPCSSLLISALAVSGIQRASSRITISCVWLPITRLHGADGILYYFSILDLEDSLIHPTSVQGPSKELVISPNFPLQAHMQKASLPSSAASGSFHSWQLQW